MNFFRVVETRSVNGIKRRRRSCRDADCGHKETTYEISAADYQFLKKARVVEKIFSTEKGPAANRQVLCHESCANWTNGSCDFGFPEAGGRFAEECTLFEQR